MEVIDRALLDATSSSSTRAGARQRDDVLLDEEARTLACCYGTRTWKIATSSLWSASSVVIMYVLGVQDEDKADDAMRWKIQRATAGATCCARAYEWRRLHEEARRLLLLCVCSRCGDALKRSLAHSQPSERPTAVFVVQQLRHAMAPQQEQTGESKLATLVALVRGLLASPSSAGSTAKTMRSPSVAPAARAGIEPLIKPLDTRRASSEHTPLLPQRKRAPSLATSYTITAAVVDNSDDNDDSTATLHGFRKALLQSESRFLFSLAVQMVRRLHTAG